MVHACFRVGRRIVAEPAFGIISSYVTLQTIPGHLEDQARIRSEKATGWNVLHTYHSHTGAVSLCGPPEITVHPSHLQYVT